MNRTCLTLSLAGAFALIGTGILSVDAEPAQAPRKCYKCLGKGTQTIAVREPCKECNGTGYIDVKKTLKDTVNANYHWQSNYRTTREVTAKKPCAKCAHRGEIPVKKSVPCVKCEGSGLLNRDGTPFKKKADATVATKNVLPEENLEPTKVVRDERPSLAERIRAKKIKVSPSGIEAPDGKGWAEFDCQSNGGLFNIQGKGTVFGTVWCPLDKDAVRVNKGSMEMIGTKPGVKQIPSFGDELETFDWSHPSVIVRVGQVVSFMNREGRFLAVKVVSAHETTIHIEFSIY